jgi:hypothetical protein
MSKVSLPKAPPFASRAPRVTDPSALPAAGLVTAPLAATSESSLVDQAIATSLSAASVF